MVFIFTHEVVNTFIGDCNDNGIVNEVFLRIRLFGHGADLDGLLEDVLVTGTRSYH